MGIPLSKALLSRTELAKIKKRALRHGAWFKVLSRIERVQIDLTIKVVDKVRSVFLAKILHPVITKLLDALESPIKRLMRSVGISLAYKICAIGKKLGCKSAENWIENQGFVQFITITYINTPKLYRTT